MNLPPPLSWLWKGWMTFSHAFGRVMSFIILTILWVVGFGIYGIVMKIARLLRKKEDPKDSYWIDLEPLPAEHLLRQF